MLVVFYQYKTFVNIYVISLSDLLTDLSCTKEAVYFNNSCIANLSLT